MAMDMIERREISQLTGDDEETLKRVYAHFRPDYLKRATDALQLGSSQVASALHVKGREPENGGSLPENVVILRP
jgi:hypothetical protein